MRLIRLLLLFLIGGGAVINPAEIAQVTCGLNFDDEGECYSFTSWSNVNKMLANSSSLIFSPIINMIPAAPLVLRSELNLTALLNAFTLNSYNYLQLAFNMLGVQGLDLIKWPRKGQLYSRLPLVMAFEDSQIDIYFNATLASDLNCSKDVFLPLLVTENNNTLFNSVFDAVVFRKENRYPTADKPICPYIFYNSNMVFISLFDQINAILISNLWRFQQIGVVNETTIDSNIVQLSVSGYGFSLDTVLMHPLVFEQVQNINIYSSIGSIQSDLLKHFNKLDELYIYLYSLKNFFHKIGLSWLQSFLTSSQISVIFENDIITAENWVNGPDYTYPEQDFCIFAQYGLQTNILYFIESTNLTDCTNTIKWLLANDLLNNTANVFENYPETKRMYAVCGNITNNETDNLMNQRESCNITTLPIAIYAEYYQLKFIFEFVQDLFIFIAIPFACLVGLFFNLLIIWTVNRNKEKELKDQFYKYMQLNSVFNCLYCFLFLFYPINSCTDTLTDYFCSSIRKSQVTQLYKIVFLTYFGEATKLCANIFYILMNVNRYMLIGRDNHLPVLEKISNWDIKWIIGVSVLFSLLVNIGHVFQYQITNFNIYVKQHYSYAYLYSEYPMINAFYNLALYVYLLLYFVLNYFGFLIVNTSVEIILVRKLGLELAEKRKKIEHMTTSSSSQPRARMSFRKRRKQEMEAKTEQRAILMVVVNAAINFIFRLPELIFLLSFSDEIFPNNAVADFIFLTFRSLTELTTDVTYFCYILTFTANFVIYYLFNQKFRSTFSKWMHVKKKTP